MQEDNLIIYTNSDGNIIVDAIYKDETLWLTQKGIAKVFECSIDNVSLHLKNIFNDGELNKETVVENSSITAGDGKNYKTNLYNLDAIIAVGYRINSKKATEFRIWATTILKEYITKGFTLNDERFIKGNKYNSKYQEKIYNKLVRDNIPTIIKQDNEIPFTRILDDNEYRIELYKKLQEECNEVIEAKNSKEILEELSDILEILKAIAELENVNINVVMDIANQKRIKRGGFEKRLFLEKTITK